MADPTFKPKLPSFGNKDGDQVITSSGIIYEYNAEKREWVNIGVVPVPEIVDPTTDGLVSPELYRKLALLQELIEQGFDFSKFKLATDVEDPYYYLFHSGDDLIKFAPERTSEPKEVRASIIVARIADLGDGTAKITMSINVPIQIDEWAGLFLETIHGNYEIVSNTQLTFIVKSENINIFGGDRGKIIKPEKIQTRLRIEIDRGRLYQKLIRNCCVGPKGVVGEVGDTGTSGMPGAAEVFQLPVGTTDGAFSWDATVETPIETPISLRLFGPDDDDAILIEILHPIDGSAPSIIINDASLNVEVTTFESDYESTSKRFFGSITIEGSDLAGWRYKARQRGAKGDQGSAGSGFVEVIEQILEDPSVRSTQAVVSLRKAAANDDIVIFENALFEEVPVANLAAINGDTVDNIITNEFVGAKFSISDARDIGFFKFAPKEYVVPPLEIPLWTPTGDCVQARRWSQYRFNWFTQTDPNYLFSIITTPKPPEQCCQEDFFFCPNVGDQPCGITGSPKAPIPFPVPCICECDNLIFSGVKDGIFLMPPIDLTDPENAVDLSDPAISIGPQFDDSGEVDAGEGIEVNDNVPEGEFVPPLPQEESSGIPDAEVQSEALSTVESVVDGSENKFCAEVKLAGDGEITVSLDFDPDICGGAIFEREGCAFVDAEAVRATFMIENPDGTGTISSIDIVETTEIPTSVTFQVGSQLTILESEPPAPQPGETVGEGGGGEGDSDFVQVVVPIQPPIPDVVDPPCAVLPPPAPSFAPMVDVVGGNPITSDGALGKGSYAIKYNLDNVTLSAVGDGRVIISFGDAAPGSLLKSPTNVQAPLVHDPLQNNTSVEIGNNQLLFNTMVAGEQEDGPFGPGTYAFADDITTGFSSQVPKIKVRDDEWSSTTIHVGIPISSVPPEEEMPPSIVPPIEEVPIEIVPEDIPGMTPPTEVPPSITTTPTFKITSMVNMTGVDYCRGYRLTVSARSNRLDPEDPGTTVVGGPGTSIADPETPGLVIIDDQDSTNLFLGDPVPSQLFPVNIISELNASAFGENANSVFAENMIGGGVAGGVLLTELKFGEDVNQVIAEGGIAAGYGCMTMIYMGSEFVDECTPIQLVDPPSFAGLPEFISIISGGGQTGVAGEDLDAIIYFVTDGQGVPASGVSVTFVPSSGTVTPVMGITDVNGQISVIWTLPTGIGGQSIDAQVVGGSNPSISTGATSEAGPASTSGVAGGNGQSGVAGNPLPSPIVVLVTDQYGNPVEGEYVTFIPDFGSAAPVMAVTNSSGFAQTIWTTGLAVGVQQLAIVVSGVPTIQATSTATPAIGVPDDISLISGDGQSQTVNQIPGTALEVLVVDGALNPVVGATVLWGVTGGGGSVTASSLTNGFGIASIADWQLGTASGSNTLEATVSGFPLSGSVGFTATGDPDVPTSMVLVSGDGQSAQVSVALGSPLVVRLMDTFGNYNVGESVNWAVSGGAGSITPSSLTNSMGEASATWTMGAGVGPGTAEASFGALPDVGFTATATPMTGTPDNISLVAGSGQMQVVNQIPGIALEVLVVDAGLLPVVGATVLWNVTMGGGSVTASSLTNGFGIASIADWQLGTVTGSNFLQATVSGFPVAGSVGFPATGTPDVPVNVALLTGDSNGGTVGGALFSDMRVFIRDQFMNAVGSGHTVDWAVTNGAAVLDGATSVTDIFGIAENNLTLDNLVSNAPDVEASVSGGVSTYEFTSLVPLPDVPDNVATSSGTGQSAVVGGALGSAMGVFVTDQFGNPVGSGETVDWAVTGGVAVLDSATSVTNGSSIATNNLTLDNLVSNQPTIEASVSGGATSDTFSPTSLPDVAVDGGTSVTSAIPSTGGSIILVPVIQIGGNYAPFNYGEFDLGRNPFMSISPPDACAFDHWHGTTDLLDGTNVLDPLPGGCGHGTKVATASGIISDLGTPDGAGLPEMLIAVDSTDMATWEAGGAGAKPDISSGVMVAVVADGVQTHSVTVVVGDTHGNPVAGETVSLSSSVGADTVSAPAVTNAAGEATFTISTTQTGSAPGGAAVTRTFSANVTSGFGAVTDVSMADFHAGAPVDAGSSVAAPAGTVITDETDSKTVTITLVDANGNPTPDMLVDTFSTGLNNTFTPSGIQNTNASGQVVLGMVSQTPGVKTVNGFTNGTFSPTANASVTFVQGTFTVSAVAGDTPAVGSFRFTFTTDFTIPDDAVMNFEFGGGDGSAFSLASETGITWTASDGTEVGLRFNIPVGLMITRQGDGTPIGPGAHTVDITNCVVGTGTCTFTMEFGNGFDITAPLGVAY